jgi:hypothetical protein
MNFWSPEEKEAFIATFRTHGLDYSALARAIPSKAVSQIRTFYQNYKIKLGLDKIALPPTAIKPGTRKRKADGGLPGDASRALRMRPPGAPPLGLPPGTYLPPPPLDGFGAAGGLPGIPGSLPGSGMYAGDGEEYMGEDMEDEGLMEGEEEGEEGAVPGSLGGFLPPPPPLPMLPLGTEGQEQPQVPVAAPPPLPLPVVADVTPAPALAHPMEEAPAPAVALPVPPPQQQVQEGAGLAAPAPAVEEAAPAEQPAPQA